MLGGEVGPGQVGAVGGDDNGVVVREIGQCFQPVDQAADPAAGFVVNDGPALVGNYATGHQDIGFAQEGVNVAIGVRLQQIAEIDLLAAKGDFLGGVDGVARACLGGE